MRACVYALAVTALVAGCATDHEPEVAVAAQGVAELQIDAASLSAGTVSRVEVESDGQLQDLARNPNTGTFDGTLVLGAGSHSLVARAFLQSGIFFPVEQKVGESQPLTVEVQPGIVTRVELRILALQMTGPQQFGPIIDSLVFPTTTEAATPTTFTISAVVPGGGTAGYSWGSNCPDSSFSTPGEATTAWTKPTPGACTITATAFASGFQVAQTFGIVVFPAGANSGAVTVTTAFVNPPNIQLSLPSLGCFIGRGSDGSCQTTIASPGTTPFQFAVFDWGNSAPGT